ncbi:MAG TPA: helix-turn-helix domain-containing protein [Anaerolineae bacterium]
MKSFQPEQEFVISDLDTLRVIADPLRNQILEALIMETLTVKQVADRLGLSSSKLYYHVNLLEKHGLIQVVDTRMVANIQEKYYHAVATSYRVEESLLSFKTDEGKATIDTIIAATLDATKEDVLRSLEARTFALQRGAPEQPRRAILVRQTSRIPESQAAEFGERLNQLLADFDAANDEETAEPRQTYALAVAFYPSIYFPDDGAEG